MQLGRLGVNNATDHSPDAIRANRSTVHDQLIRSLHRNPPRAAGASDNALALRRCVRTVSPTMRTLRILYGHLERDQLTLRGRKRERKGKIQTAPVRIPARNEFREEIAVIVTFPFESSIARRTKFVKFLSNGKFN